MDFHPSCDVRHDDGTAITRIVVRGDVDATSAHLVQQAFLEALRRHRPARIDMDVRGVTFLDSAGIRTLVVCQADARQVDCRIIVVNTPPMVHRVLEITGLLDHFGVTQAESADAA